MPSATGDLNYGRLSANMITTPSSLLLWGGAAFLCRGRLADSELMVRGVGRPVMVTFPVE
jgi:hypothetical protein